jgi:protein ImuA
MTSISETIARLRREIRCLEHAAPALGGDCISSGCESLDRLLPDGGVPRGSLVEWLGGGAGSGAATLALHYARQACRQGGNLVVVDRLRQVYPPALAGWGVDLAQVILVHPRDVREEIWAWDQSLRCTAVGAVWGEIERIDGRSFRRLQLAVEDSGGVGLLLRPLRARREPTWADVRLLVEPRCGERGRQLCVHLLHCRGAAARGTVLLELDEWSGRLRKARGAHETRLGGLAAELARTTADRRSTGTYGASHRVV